jgi:hypothetical protein
MLEDFAVVNSVLIVRFTLLSPDSEESEQLLVSLKLSNQCFGLLLLGLVSKFLI